MNFSYSYIKIFSSVQCFEWIFYPCVMLRSCNLLNVGSLSFTDLPKYWYISLYINKNHILKYSYSSEEAVKLTGVETEFPKFWFVLDSFSIIIGNIYRQVFSLK